VQQDPGKPRFPHERALLQLDASLPFFWPVVADRVVAELAGCRGASVRAARQVPPRVFFPFYEYDSSPQDQPKAPRETWEMKTTPIPSCSNDAICYPHHPMAKLFEI